MAGENFSTRADEWSDFRIIAHRGASAVAPENTLAAIARAADLGARSVELDVMLSADGVPVIIHDTDLARTTDGTGPVAAQSHESLARLDAGSWFDAAFAGEGIPSLADAVTLILDRDLSFNLEIKPSPGEDRATAAGAIALLAETWPEDAALVLSSASIEALAVARDTAPRWRRGLIADVPPPDWRDVLADLGCASLHCAAPTATPSLIEAVHDAGYRLLAYTVNRPAKAATLFKYGVDGIFTDDPAAMIARFGA
jgi:glycerophosphoryl diester phosphodiesterase